MEIEYLKPVELISDFYLTEIRDYDAESLAHHLNHLSIYYNTLMIPYPYELEDAKEYIKYTRIAEEETGVLQNFAIRHKDQVVGGLGLLYNHGYDSHKSEIGYWVSVEFRREGLATVGVKALCDFAFAKTKLTRLEAHVFIENEHSKKVLLNNGFIEEGISKKTFIKDGVFKDTFFLAKLKDGM